MAATKRSPFLDILPAELRLHIYTLLLVTPSPLKGPVARESTKYDLHTAILRTNKQIYAEARSIFFGRNTFYITSIPPPASADDGDDTEGSGAFEPPLQLKDLPLVRHLQVDVLYYPRCMRRIMDPRTGIWRPVSAGAERYITSLSYLLGAVESTLLTLKLCADTRRYLDEKAANRGNDSGNSKGATDRVAFQKMLTGFYMADADTLFRKTLAQLNVRDVTLRFDFSEIYFDFTVTRHVLCQQSFVKLAGQVLLMRCDIRTKAAMQDLGDMVEEMPKEGVVNLIPHTW
ncbi:cytochrome p450 3a10 [Pyrenophora seminiperda CCB06]|uniref:Cytochrome p450 3a10 n=1 Tax=Pyrenophora seminiperda CCB06 TaxID=1302712 RepID=A0A3M7M967_9PLEO|nr:cytochrome p450 3a10 [Pyrenophora seminiperda CCB06]